MKYAIIGAGWAGCSAAVELTKRGHEVHLFEASRTLGGRARTVSSHALTIDNGQHILIGAYKATLALLKTVGINQKDAFLRQPLQLCYPVNTGGMEFIAAKLPAPFHLIVALLTSKGLALDDKMALARFATTARWMDWHLNEDCTVAELLKRFDQTEKLVQLMWQPLCVAALNTPIERASAQVFLNVLKDSFGARRSASDMLIPRMDLTNLLPHAVEKFIEARGGNVHLGGNVHGLIKNETKWQLQFQHPLPPSFPNSGDEFDGIVIATPPNIASKLLTPFNLAQSVPEFEFEPITTCYLKYPESVKLTRPFLALVEHPEKQAWGQFVFDRGQTLGQHGLLAVVVSASHIAIEHGHEELALNCAKQLADYLKRPELLTPEKHLVITEKHATFFCTPGIKRPSNQLPISNLTLAGDYTESRYPATLEAAVQSGRTAAELLK